jgi:hypothetical protein
MQRTAAWHDRAAAIVAPAYGEVEQLGAADIPQPLTLMYLGTTMGGLVGFELGRGVLGALLGACLGLCIAWWGGTAGLERKSRRSIARSKSQAITSLEEALLWLEEEIGEGAVVQLLARCSRPIRLTSEVRAWRAGWPEGEEEASTARKALLEGATRGDISVVAVVLN